LNNVIALNIALSDTNGFEVLWQKRGSAISSIVEHEDSFGAVKVVAKRLDSVVKELKIDRVDLIKVDVEGAEIKVIRGALNALARCRPMLIAEVRERNLDEFNMLMKSLAFGYERLENGNFLCVAEDKASRGVDNGQNPLR